MRWARRAPSDSTSLFRCSSSKNSFRQRLSDTDGKKIVVRKLTISEYGRPVFLCNSLKCLILLPGRAVSHNARRSGLYAYLDRSPSGRITLLQGSEIPSYAPPVGARGVV